MNHSFNQSRSMLESILKNDWLIKESSWFYVDYEKAKEKMKGMIQNYDKLVKKSQDSVPSLIEKFSESAIDKQFHDMLNKHVPEFAIEKKIVLPKLKKIELPKLTKITPPATVNA